MEMLLTNNFYNWVKTILTSSNNAENTPVTASSGMTSSVYIPNGIRTVNNVLKTQMLVNPAGFDEYHMNNFSLFKFPVTSATGEGTRFFVGSGTTPPTVDDYALESLIDGVTISITGSHNNGKITFLVGVSNTTQTDITINEIGLVKQIYFARNEYDQKALFGRCVLDEPITLASGEGVSFTIEIEI